jgi:hypothetical protein
MPASWLKPSGAMRAIDPNGVVQDLIGESPKQSS